MKTIHSEHKQIICDTITPISSFLNLRDHFSNVSLFESSDHLSKDKSKSFVCINPIITISTNGQEIKLREHQVLTQTNQSDQLLQDIEKLCSNYTFSASEIHHLNGFFGVIAYDSIPQMETIEFKAKSRFKNLPDIYFAVYQYIIVFDNFKNTATLISNAFEQGELDFSLLENNLFKSQLYDTNFEKTGPLKSNETDQSFGKKIKKAKTHIKNGEVFQMVLSRSFSQPFSGDEFEVYRQLRSLNPSPYMFYFDLEKAKLIGASPEAQFRVNNGIAEIHPIAGTLKRTGNLTEDLKRSDQLLNDAKENAEHTMLVDLARNDLNITCENVEVIDYKKIQQFSHVIHMVSKVTGTLKNTSIFKAFAGTFPAGTLSGAPKHRAMTLIDEMENDNRGYYGGAIGQITPNGDLNMAIIIRSTLALDHQLHYQAGAGIVMDSKVENEIQEVYNKVGAVQKAIALASQLKHA